MAPGLLAKIGLVARLVSYVAGVYWEFFKFSRAQAPRKQLTGESVKDDASPSPPKNIVVIGASFSGYHAARLIAAALPADGSYRLVVVEPNSHFHFTWVLPRLCVAEGHEHKALIPYGPYFKGVVSNPELVRWITDRAVSVSRTGVTLQSGEEIPYEYLVVATGSGAADGLPSRVGAATKEKGLELMRDMQQRIKGAQKVVVVGGGAAGVELATDAKDLYPDKEVVLVHSRHAVMHRFGPELQAAALKGLASLGVEVILNERASVDSTGKVVKLTSGKTFSCDVFISCIGQRPNSQLVAALAPGLISPSGKICVRPTLQVADDSLPNVYACGDVTEDPAQKNPNARSAMKQAMVVGHNIGVAISGADQSHVPLRTYSAHWGDAVIKLTLGLYKSVVHFGDDRAELLWNSKEKDIALMSERSWYQMGAKPYEDATDELAQYRQQQ